MKVEVASPILHEGKHQGVGTVLDVPIPLGNELIASGKCVLPGSGPAKPEKKESKK